MGIVTRYRPQQKVIYKGQPATVLKVGPKKVEIRNAFGFVEKVGRREIKPAD